MESDSGVVAVAPATSPLALVNTTSHAHDHHNSHPQSHHQGLQISTSLLFIIIPVVSFFVLLAVFLILVMLRRLKATKNHENLTIKTTTSSNSSSCTTNNNRPYRFSSRRNSFDASPDVKSRCLYGGTLGFMPPASKLKGVQVFTYREIEMATDGFSEGNVIGNGRFGVMFRGILGDGTVAAIKRLHREGKQGERDFRVEVDLLSRLHSPYLVELLGYCADQHHRLLVFEFLPNGSLQKHLHTSHKQHHHPLNWGTRLRIAFDCARALEFLHEHIEPSVIHRDFKSMNVVLDHNFRAKVSDLGSAKTSSDKINGQISAHMMGSNGYVAPESASTGKFSTKSDVYSYGVVLLELLTGRVPIDIKRPPGEHVLVSWALPRLTNREKVMEMVDPALQGQYSKKELIQVAAIAAVCVQQEADYRPFMTDVVQSLIPLVKNLSTTCPSTSSRFQRRVSPRI